MAFRGNSAHGKLSGALVAKSALTLAGAAFRRAIPRVGKLTVLPSRSVRWLELSWPGRSGSDRGETLGAVRPSRGFQGSATCRDCAERTGASNTRRVTAAPETRANTEVHLVDGTFELFRAFYGAPPAVSPGGVQVGASRGLMRSLHALLRNQRVTHIACAFDHVIESFRNDLYRGYKTGEGVDPVLMAQFPTAERVTRALGIVTWPMLEFEADDAIATACERLRALSEVSRVIICSPDKDLGQCALDSKVVLWDRVRDRRIDREGVLAKFGVLPESIPDYLALVGDTADGIPGIPRWGAKGAACVLRHYQHLEAIPHNPAEWAVKGRGAATLAANLAANYDEALLFRRLATLRCDVPLVEDSLSQLRYRGVDLGALKVLCDELGDEEFFRRAAQSDGNSDADTPLAGQPPQGAGS